MSPPAWLAVSLVATLGVSAGACKKSDPKQDETGLATRGTPSGGAPVAPAEPGGSGSDPETGEDTSYQFTSQPPSPAPAGTEGVARFVIHPGSGYKMNKEYPTKLTLEPPAGVAMAKTVLEPADAEAFTEKELTFAVKLTAKQAGEFTIPATIKFAVCTDATCDPKKKKIALLMTAQ